MKHNIYIASSWRNRYQPFLVVQLREWGHQVYDFRNPLPGNDGFHWSELDPGWQTWNVSRFRMALQHPIAEKGFAVDMKALSRADIVILLLPSGRSAHCEAAWGKGCGKPVIVHGLEPCEPELMYKIFNAITVSNEELFQFLEYDIGDLQKLRLGNGPLNI